MDNFLSQFIDFFLPGICASCKEKLSANENTICEKCFHKIRLVTPALLAKEFEKKFKQEQIIEDFFSLFIFSQGSPIQDLLHDLKYNKKFKLGLFLGKLLAQDFGNKITGWKPDVIIPIPLYNLKKAERGFNQSYYIAKGLAKQFNISVKSNVVKRTRFTETQTTLNIDERKENMKDAFVVIKPNAIKGKSILLLDDVITTGATIIECGKVLKDKGAKNIFAISVALSGY